MRKELIVMMKLFRMFGRSIRDALKSVIRNLSLSIASIFSITITLLLVATSVVSSASVNNFTRLIKQDFTIVVFISNDLDQTGIDELKTTIQEMDNVDELSFESKYEISETMKKTSDIFNKIISNWDEGENPLQNTLSIKVKNSDMISNTAKTIEKLDGVSFVKYGEGMIENMLSVFRIIEKGLIVLVVALIVVTAFLITNTIKLTIFARRREVEIMRLVGASNINIELSFIFEGLFLGLLGSLTPVIILIYGYLAIYEKYGGALFSPFIRLISPDPFIFIVSGFLILLGITVGMFGSLVAVRKHLKI